MRLGPCFGAAPHVVPPADDWAGGETTGPFFVAAPARSLAYRCISARMKSAQRSPIMMLGALVLPPIKRGMTEASAT